MTCLADEEDQAMLAEFREFDRKMIHEKYRAVVEELENGSKGLTQEWSGCQRESFRI